MGPKSVFFWAPFMKWGLVVAGLKDLTRPADKLSVSQNSALALTGMIWVRYCFVITPVNYPLAAVNFFVGTNGLVQLGRIAHTEYHVGSIRSTMASSFRSTGRKIVAIGRNFADHAKELNNAVPTSPFFFLKPTSSYIGNGAAVEIPRGVVAHHEGTLSAHSNDVLMHAVELAVVIGETGRDIRAADASRHIGGYALAVDMTARNMQEKAKKAGLPWSAAKGFDTFTPISDMVDASRIADPHNIDLWLKVDGATRQRGNTRDMIFSIPQLLEHVSSIMTLQTGDVVLTGTPKGVSELRPGDTVTAGLQLPCSSEILAQLRLPVTQRENGFVFDG
ncbi:acylpyruvate hydrolase [Malassezia sp. CBS 17886]|nr:acylpyruvate hydrolase [Malassezia sp. CBS 17886]